MHAPETVTQTLDILWNNYLSLAQQSDADAMDPGTLSGHAALRTSTQPLRIATWLTRQAFFLEAWALWEEYSNTVCTRPNADRPKSKHRTHVEWVRDTMKLNGQDFHDWEWFLHARCIRNLIAHYAGRVHDPRARNLLHDGRCAFPDIGTFQDNYLHLTHCHVAQLQVKIEEYVEDSVQLTEPTVLPKAPPNASTDVR